MLKKLQGPRPMTTTVMYCPSPVSLVVALIFVLNSILIVWLIIAVLLYSYNFVILLIPTTTERISPADRDIAPISTRSGPGWRFGCC